MILELDNETIKMIEDYSICKGDDSYANHLAEKILELYEEQS